MNTPTPGTLHIVATPIGNLGDFTARAVETLKRVAAICAEDTRHTRPLLQQFGIATPLLALHDHNESKASAALVHRLLAGDSLALVSDAGTPLVSDPGYRLVRMAREAGIRVSPVPGASALVAALSVAGLPSDRFVFEGFLSAKASARRERLQGLVAEPRTLIFYESSHRIRDFLVDARDAFGGTRKAVVARELTKLFETVLDGDLDALLQQVESDANQQKGEFVVLVEGAADDVDAKIAEGQRLYAKLCEYLKPSQAAKLAAELSGAPRKALYGGEAVE
ncbi:16S rRNA (cytidine(1402)-2'-O)-methyltransferase [Solilutibacter silvestris]|uniref:Ribosomal RNA small subunit methyltransferase I n=1 Tax=Solilutibacter silvestris TaxID=1645665 RepID=A0A2K1Q2K9_9GAMM|nr:16S rRNA (cytidine(1402)-2'-O)-methyltransferase [Lysobacter silvestris]PNS09272.1 putative S-adenosylmethionine-dependent methyltransferase YraL [Lysobacter silvestris]